MRYSVVAARGPSFAKSTVKRRKSLARKRSTPGRFAHHVVILDGMIAALEGIMESDPEFLLRRAKEESLRALETDQPEAANVHQKLAVQYSAKAAIALANQDQGNASEKVE